MRHWYNLSASRWLSVGGIVLLVAGAQAFLFERQLASVSDGASQSLAALQRESADNQRINEALRALQLAYRASNDDAGRQAILALRDETIALYSENRAEAVETLLTGVSLLEGSTPESIAAIDEARREAGKLARLYEPRTQTARELYANPPWYLWPTAALANNDEEKRHALGFNQALYMVHSGNRGAAVTLLEDLRVAASESDRRMAEIDFAMARISFAAWATQPDPAVFDSALERAVSSVRHHPGNPRARQFLEYLLSLDRSAATVEMEPEEGQGDGEGRGERGVISEELRDF